MPFFILFISGIALGQTCRFFPFLSLFLCGAFAVLVVPGSARGGSIPARALRGFLLIVCALAGFALSWQSHSPMHGTDFGGSTVEAEVTVSSEAMPAGRNEGLFSQSARVTAARAGGKELPLREVRLLSPLLLSEGQAYRLTARPPRDSHFLNPGSLPRIPALYVLDAAESRPPAAGPLGRVLNVFSQARAELNRELRVRFSERTAPFLMSQITGERRFMSKELRDAFNVTGLAHLLSISGTHFGLLFLVLFRIWRLLMRSLPHRVLLRLTLRVTPSQLGALLCLPFMTCYLGISDASVPAIRSFIMITFFLLGLVLQRRGLWLNTVLIAAVIILASDPAALSDLSFQLSFVAVVCIGTALERLRAGKTPDSDRGNDPEGGAEREPAHGVAPGSAPEKPAALAGILRLCRQGLAYSVATSLAATIGTAPLVAFHFHYFSIISPLTNLVVTPFVGFLLLPVALLSAFAFLLSGYFPFTAFIEGMADLAVTSVLYLGRLSVADLRIPGFPSALLFAFYAGLFGYVAVTVTAPPPSGRPLTKRLWRVAAAAAIIPLIAYAALASLRPTALTVTYLDVGQGDAAVVELPDGKTLVIDTGRQGVQVGDYLRYRGKRGIDALVLSHGQSDHVGGVRHLAGNFSISEVWDNGNLVFDETLAGPWERRSLARGDVIEASGVRMTVLHPYRGYYTAQSNRGEVNNDSLVLSLRGRGRVFLFTGDIEQEAQEDLLHLGPALRSSVLKVPHHGSRSAFNEAFVRAVSPEVALISAGRSNIYGFPHREVLGALSDARVYRTDCDGAVLIAEGTDGSLSVKTWREFQLAEARTLQEEAANLKRLLKTWP